MPKSLMLILFNLPIAALPCPFEDLQLSELEGSLEFILGAERATSFPAALFNSFEQNLAKFDANECQDAIRIRPITHGPTSQRFFAVYTTQDGCDGGNTYGLILKSADLAAKNVVATIQDSFIFCR